MKHLVLAREEVANDRKPRRGRGAPPPADPRAHGASLRSQLKTALANDVSQDGFDPRRLLKLQVAPAFQADQLEAIPGVEVVSHEAGNLVLALADAAAVGEFEARLSTLSRDGQATRRDILFALQGFAGWGVSDRTGPALAELFPVDQRALLDVELWPLERPADRARMLEAFRLWTQQRGVEILDSVTKPGLVLFRLRPGLEGLQELLRHRDVRTVDLPPRVGLDSEFLRVDIGGIESGVAPEGSPILGILDTGIVAGHPFLKAAVGEAAGFIPPRTDVEDQDGHGTQVAGVGLFGDVAECVRQRRLIPAIRLVSGRVFANDGGDESRLVENAVEEAVRYFFETYGCRVFCLAYGDRNKVYDGGHVRGLAYVLDLLSRELGVLFVVPAGNLLPEELPADPRASYPDYLLEADARVLDPGTALNVITVGGIARFEADANAQRYPDSIESLPIARAGWPSPFTRSGLSVRGAVKPDLVAHAGNWAVRRIGENLATQRLGVLTLGKDFASGRPFVEATGTSLAAPAVAHLAAKVSRLPDVGSTDLVRALLAAHARWPVSAEQLFPDEGKPAAREKTLRLLGYGAVEGAEVLESSERAVTLVSEEKLSNDRHHFYEIPLPEDLWLPGQRPREVTAALAYSPEVRTTRIDYRATEISFQVVCEESPEAVAAWFRRDRGEKAERIGEYATGRSIPGTERSRGTLQRATWTLTSARDQEKFRLFVVVTCHDRPWSTVSDRPEAYALALVIADRENGAAQLYSQIQAQINARVAARLRQRVRLSGPS